MMSLWDALRMNMMISYQELVRTFPNKSHKTIDGLIVNLNKQGNTNELQYQNACQNISLICRLLSGYSGSGREYHYFYR
ncbi:hypothetical protein C3409_25965 [Klebsiella oxytoca]|nr:hypothetical protein C2U44_28685 [Klebsiella oxytoca]POT85406.1 hypothetical protein C3417_23910 [Klebsiella oxytoca]POV48231.1 hypothetical protein C3409_25965 [Klebsiella oxytoca]